MRDPEETRKARVGFMWTMLVFTLLWVAMAKYAEAQTTRYWQSPPTITYDRGSVTGAVQVATEYAAWSVGQRTGMELRIAGFGEPEVNGTIHVSVVSLAQAWADGATLFASAYVKPWYYTGTDRMARAELKVVDCCARFLTNRLRAIMAHELVHAMGSGGHSEDPHDVMFHSIDVNPRYTLSHGDIGQLHPAYASNLCFAEVTPDGDVYIPSIGGYGAEIVTTGAGVWRLGMVEDSLGDCSGALQGSTVTLDDVRAMGGRYVAELEMVGDTLTLINVVDHPQVMEARARYDWPDLPVDSDGVVE